MLIIIQVLNFLILTLTSLFEKSLVLQNGHSSNGQTSTDHYSSRRLKPATVWHNTYSQVGQCNITSLNYLPKDENTVRTWDDEGK